MVLVQQWNPINPMNSSFFAEELHGRHVSETNFQNQNNLLEQCMLLVANSETEVKNQSHYNIYPHFIHSEKQKHHKLFIQSLSLLPFLYPFNFINSFFKSGFSQCVISQLTRGKRG
jgi:hypothetical protein